MVGYAGPVPASMSFAINLEGAVPRVFSKSQMNTSTPGRLPQMNMKLRYRVKVPLNACMMIDRTTSFRIPRGSLIEWLPRPNDGRGLAIVRWLEEDCLVSSAELNQTCERVRDGQDA